MTDPTSGQYTPAGWYPDPSGAHQERWWDGSHWSETTQPYPAAAGMPSMPAATPYSYHAAAAVNPGINPSTPAVWVLAFLPLMGIISAVAALVLSPSSFDATAVYSAEYAFPGVTTANLVTNGIAFVAWIGGAFIALADRNALLTKGIQSPFAWGWAFIPLFAPLTYLIGRTVVVKRQTTRGLAPLMTWIGLTVGTFFVGIVLGVIVAIALSSTFSP